MVRLFLTFLPLMTFSVIGNCQQNPGKQNDARKEKISEVVYFGVGGGRPGYLKLKITRDSIKYQYEMYSDTTSTTSLIVKQEKNSRKSWSALIKSINLADFDQQKSARAQSPVDGFDQIITIKTQIKDHRLILDIENSAPIHNFILQIEAILKVFNAKARLIY